MLLSELMQCQVPSDVAITGLSLDSRRIQYGDAFFAVAGGQTDGRIFIDQAVSSGAGAVVYESGTEQLDISVPAVAVNNLRGRLGCYAQRFYKLPRHGCIGVTGTNGKTTIASILQQLLASVGKPCGYIGTLGCSTSMAGTTYCDVPSVNLTTPDIFTLYTSVQSMLAEGCSHVVMEVSSHALDQERVAGITFDYAVFSNLSRDHFDYHASFDAYFLAKKKLFDQCHKAVINLDDAYGRVLFESLEDIVTIGCTSQHMLVDQYGDVDVLVADRITTTLDSVAFRLRYQHQSVQLQADFTGSFAVANLLAAIAVLLDMGYTLHDIVKPVSMLVPPPGRLERVSERPVVFIDYAHTPDALEHTLIELHSLVAATQGRLFLVFGCGGDRDKGKRPLMGSIAGRYADRVFVTDDNPRHEPSQEIIDQIVAGFDPAHLDKVVVEPDRAAAIALAIDGLDGNDCLLIAGKGHETGQMVGNRCLDFSDHKVVSRLVSL